jgi:hypothetical protein
MAFIICGGALWHIGIICGGALWICGGALWICGVALWKMTIIWGGALRTVFLKGASQNLCAYKKVAGHLHIFPVHRHAKPSKTALWCQFWTQSVSQPGQFCKMQVLNLRQRKVRKGLGSMLWSQFSAIFAYFRRKKLALFSKTNVMIKFLHYLDLFWVKNANSFAEFFGENILKIITSVPALIRSQTSVW